MTHELIDIIDTQPTPGEYVGCTHPMTPITVFGVTVDAWHPYHAMRRVISAKWEGRCECCGHGLRYCCVTQDETGQFHCFGRTCLNVVTLGEESARRFDYAERIEEKESGFCATFTVPQKLWDLPRENRPAFVRLWKGEARTRRGLSKGNKVWKMTVWGNDHHACLENCVALDKLLGLKLS